MLLCLWTSDIRRMNAAGGRGFDALQNQASGFVVILSPVEARLVQVNSNMQNNTHGNVQVTIG
jgi:hypothetical protein